MTNGVVYCNRCGTQNSSLAKFCANCGSPFGADAPGATTSPAEVMLPPQGPAGVASAPSAYGAAPVVRYGGFWIRFVAVIIDGIALSIVVFPIAGILGLMIGVAGGRVEMPGAGIHIVRGITLWGLFVCAGWIYEAGLESSSKQATLGKMAMGLKVTDEYGKRISFARASARYFSKLISRAILMIGYIMAGFTARKQALHDIIAGTLVMRT